jgi:phosphoribosylformylglycinamidine synthase PurS subunit
MKFAVTVHIMPRQGILDPQGKATESGLHQLGFNSIDKVRIGKQIQFEIEAQDLQTANETADGACRKLLANLIMESYTFEIKALTNA